MRGMSRRHFRSDNHGTPLKIGHHQDRASDIPIKAKYNTDLKMDPGIVDSGTQVSRM